MAIIDKTYHNLLNGIINTGFKYEDPNRKDVNRIQIPHYQLIHDFKDGFPAITTKKLYWKGVVAELLWILKGDINIKYLVNNGINIWNKDAYNYYLKKPTITGIPKLSYEDWLKRLKSKNWSHGINGDLGRIYGAQWRAYRGKLEQKSKETISPNHRKAIIGYNNIDQISNLIKGLKENPMGTRHIVTAWNPAELDVMALPPCHWSFEILVEPLIKQSCGCAKYKEGEGVCADYLEDECKDSGSLCKSNYQFTLKWHQRSCDSFLGVPFNIASYALLAHIIGKMVNMVPKGIIGDLSNVHIYEPHLDAVKEQLNRDVDKYGECDLNISTKARAELKDGLKYIDNKWIDIKDFNLYGYKSYPSIPAEMLAYNK